MLHRSSSTTAPIDNESVNSKYLPKCGQMLVNPTSLGSLYRDRRGREILSCEWNGDESPPVAWLLMELSKKCKIKAIVFLAILAIFAFRISESQISRHMGNSSFLYVSQDESNGPFLRGRNESVLYTNQIRSYSLQNPASDTTTPKIRLPQESGFAINDESVSTNAVETFLLGQTTGFGSTPAAGWIPSQKPSQPQVPPNQQSRGTPRPRTDWFGSYGWDFTGFYRKPPVKSVPYGTDDIASTRSINYKPQTFENLQKVHPSGLDSALQAPLTPAVVAPQIVDSSLLDSSVDIGQTLAPAAPKSHDSLASHTWEKNRTISAIKPEASLLGLANFKDNWDPRDSSDNPVFWHIPKSGGSTVKDIIGSCHHLAMASEFGITDGHANDAELAVVYPKSGGPEAGRSPFINVDTTTTAGIERAKAMGFADAHLAENTVTPFVYEANDLFSKTSKGRLFALFRHPIDRAISMFYYLQVATWEPTYKPEFQNWTLEQYVHSDIVENNWMTRILSNHSLEGAIKDDSYVTIAMEVVRQKFLVGLLSDLEGSMDRFERFFRWNYHVNPTPQEACRQQLLAKGSNSNSAKKKEKPKPGNPSWEVLASQNVYDLQLYDYIQTLYKEQEAFVTGIPEMYRLVNSTCCKCNPPTFPPEGFKCPVPDHI